MYRRHGREGTRPLCQRSESPLSISVSIIQDYQNVANLVSYNSLQYFFADLERLFEPTYEPHEQDIVHCRARTIGITETTFQLKDHEMLMVDVGGQKSERRKWIHCFQDVTSILFLVSLSGYDQCLVEDKDAVSSSFPSNFSGD